MNRIDKLARQCTLSLLIIYERMSMNYYIKKICLMSLVLGKGIQGYTYDKHLYDNHIVHVVILDPHEYSAHYVKAHDAVFGRETVKQMAERSGATVAINGGFFEVGATQDGMPSGTSIEENIIFGLTLSEHDCLVWDKNGELSIERISPTVVAIADDVAVSVTSVNQYIQENETVLYTSGWGKNTLTPYEGRVEVSFDSDFQLEYVRKHGNNDIPEGGYVLSFPAENGLNLENLKLLITTTRGKSVSSALKGIPMLVQNGKILDRVVNNKATGHTLPYARTALGIKKDGTIVIVATEPFSSIDPKGMTLSDLKNVLMSKGEEFAQSLNKKMWEFTLFDLKNMLKKEYTSRGREIVGLTMVELAQFMIDQGCYSAINLGGGATTTIWIEGQDTLNEKAAKTAVADAIVFCKK